MAEAARPGRPREAARRAGRPAVPDLLPGAAAVGAGRGRPGRRRRGHHGQADPPPSARVRRDGGRHARARCAATGSRSRATRRAASGIFHDVPAVLPALLYARKVQRRASAVGFDWHAWDGAWGDLEEELRELREALDEAGPQRAEHEPDAHVVHELGDLLFAAVNVARLAGVDPGAGAAGGGRPVPRAGGAGGASWRWPDGLEFAGALASRSRTPGTGRRRRGPGAWLTSRPLLGGPAGVRDRGAATPITPVCEVAERSARSITVLAAAGCARPSRGVARPGADGRGRVRLRRRQGPGVSDVSPSTGRATRRRPA